MKFFYDFFPVLLFFIAFKLYDIYVATAVTIVASFVQVAGFYFKHRRFEKTHLVTFALIGVLGGATLLLENELFIKWKPTVVNWLFAVVFLGSQFIGRKTLVERMIGHTITLPGAIWHRLNMSWVLFFLGLGLANLYVMYNFDTETWVDFKLFGMMGLTFAFVFLQALYMGRYMKPQASGSSGENG